MYLMHFPYKNEYRNLKLVGATIRKGRGVVKRARGDELIGVVIYIYKCI
jgi:hypothetical protein